MTDLDAFLASTLPRLQEAERALHDGDISHRLAMWSRNDPVTLFGAALSVTGWGEIGPAFELVAAGVSGDLAYLVGIEHTTASIAGGPPTAYSLRVTTILRREDGEWKVVHRHADPHDASAGAVASGIRESRAR